jgi:hypothetical protein
MLIIATESQEAIIKPHALIRLGDACYRLNDLIGAYHAYNAALATGNEPAMKWAAAQLPYVNAYLKRADAQRNQTG